MVIVMLLTVIIVAAVIVTSVIWSALIAARGADKATRAADPGPVGDDHAHSTAVSSLTHDQQAWLRSIDPDRTNKTEP